jgi:hypothetical protein
MALGFFRNKQKLVIGIMVLLMIAFLVPSTLSMIGRGGGPEDYVVGTTRYGELRTDELRQTAMELQILRRRVPVHAAVGNRQYPPSVQLIGKAFLSLLQQGDRAALCYALLQKEARAGGMEATDAEIDGYLARFGFVDDEYQALIGQVRDQTGMGEDEIRQVIGNWLMVYKYFISSMPPTAPSLAEIRQRYQMELQQVKVRVWSVDANEYLPKVAMPSADEIETHWTRYRGARAESYPTKQSFGFGYLQPKRYIIKYLLIDAEPLARVVEVSDDAVRAYYEEHAAEYTEKVAGDQDDPNAPSERQLSLAEAWERVVRDVRPVLAAEMLEPLSVRVTALLEEYRSLPEEQRTAGPYQWVRERLIAPADALLSRPVTVNIANQPISRAVEALAEAANITDICYPWGEHGRLTLDPDVTVSLQAKDMALGEALRRVTAQIPDWPAMQWASCTEIDRVLFPLSGVDLFPLRTETVELTGEELFEHDVLGNAATAQRQGRPLIRALIELEQMRRGQKENEVVLKQGPEMLVFDRSNPFAPPQVTGKLFWRLENIRPARAPESRTPELTRRIIRDIKLKKAYRMALADANGIDTDRELEPFVKKHDLEANTTGMFSRVQAMGRGGQMVWAQVPLELPSAVMRRSFLDAAFGLIPPPEELSNRPITVLGIPGTQTVAVLKLMDFRYPPEDRFNQPAFRRFVAEGMSSQAREQIAGAWFNFANMVAPRVQWQRKQ